MMPVIYLAPVATLCCPDHPAVPRHLHETCRAEEEGVNATLSGDDLRNNARAPSFRCVSGLSRGLCSTGAAAPCDPGQVDNCPHSADVPEPGTGPVIRDACQVVRQVSKR
jgi:hypothetical protein